MLRVNQLAGFGGRRLAAGGDPSIAYREFGANYESSTASYVSGWSRLTTDHTITGGSISDFSTTGTLTYEKVSSVLTTQDYTIEIFFEYSAQNGTAANVIIDLRRNSGANGLLIYVFTDGKLHAYCNGVEVVNSAVTLSVNTKYYIAIKRSGGNWDLAVGTSGSTNIASATNHPASVLDYSGRIGIGGRQADTAFALLGKVYAVRVSVGLAGDISTVPTDPFPES
jgi:hypothetical protein